MTDRANSKTSVPRGKGSSARRLIPIVVAMTVCAFTWQAIAIFSGLPAFILPRPLFVANRLVEVLADGSLLRQSGYTLIEVVAGMALGVGTAAALGYVLSKSRLVERVLAPYIVATQAIPVVAIAPLLVIWFGPGIFSKVLICALIVFFPVLVNTVVGVRAVPRPFHDLMQSLHATRPQTLRMLELPASLPVLLGGLRIGAT
ncbi:MAG TPA: ABC transporter permease, partial [Anaerolineales bacterium]